MAGELFYGTGWDAIYTDLKDRVFRRLVDSAAPLFAYHVYGTESGKLGGPAKEAWYGRRGTAPVHWSKRNGYRLLGVTGGVWELVGDGREWRGGCWHFYDLRHLRVAYRFIHTSPGFYNFVNPYDLLGCRPAAFR